jgi:hypothetical protein
VATRRRRPTRKSQHRALLRAHRGIYPELLEFQGGGCAICGRPPNPERRHALDHDHKTMQLRGILCTICNMRLTDRITPEWLRAAAAYLENPPFARMFDYHYRGD